MTGIDLDALRRIALAATPGPWEADGNEVSQHRSCPEPWHTVVGTEVACLSCCYGGTAEGVSRTEDAGYIAAFDPPTVLALLDRLKAAEAALDRLTSDDMISALSEVLMTLYFHGSAPNAHAEAKSILDLIRSVAAGEQEAD